MILIPAVDLREGACVQLVGGSYDNEQVRLDNPEEVAANWSSYGFRRLHVVDLDAATGRGSNREIVRQILRLPGVDVQVGGGVRDEGIIAELLDDGAAAVIVGTRGMEDPGWLEAMADRFPGFIIAAADVRERRVVTRGWSRTLDRDIVGVAEELSQLPLAGVMVTAVHVEGGMSGADLTLMDDVLEACSIPVLASGGVADLRDLYALRERGVAGAIVGMALYTGAIDPRAAEEFY